MITFKRELCRLFFLETKVVLKYFPSWQDVHSNLDKDLVEGKNLLLILEKHAPTKNATKVVMTLI